MTQDQNQAPEGYVEITYLARLWDAVPDDERATPEDIRRVRGTWTKHYLDRELDHLRNPQCEIAVRSPEYGTRKWMPCGQQVNDEGRRCKRHGGPGKKIERKSYGDLRAEISALRQRLAELEAPMKPVGP